jgi:Na+/H+-translocating membrane pyrophosphatase
MENLVTNMSFWGTAALLATTCQLIWEYFRAKGRIQVAKVATLSHQSRSFFEHHYKVFTLIIGCVLVLIALNLWILPNMFHVVLICAITGALMRTLALLLGNLLTEGYIKRAVNQLLPKRFQTFFINNSNPVNAVTLLLSAGGLLFLLFSYQHKLVWTPYVVLNIFTAYAIGNCTLTLVFEAFLDNFSPQSVEVPELLNTDRLEALSGAIIATSLLGATFTDLQAFSVQFNGLGGVLLPLAIVLAGMVVSGVSALLTKLFVSKTNQQTLFAEKLTATLVMVIISYWLINTFLPEFWVFGTHEYTATEVFYAAQAGLMSGLIISKIVQLYEMAEVKFIRYLSGKAFRISVLDKALHTGLRIFSAVVPLVLLIASILLAYQLVGLYGMCISVVAMQSNLRTELSSEVAELEKLVKRSKKIFFPAH